jgi:UDP-N-acetylglucosamine 2-epimerase (non-hydrolysing)
VNIFEAVKNLTLMDPEVEIIYPVHPNPNVSERLKDLGDNDRIHLLDPLCYEDLLLTLQHVHLVMTDSGGIQEETPSFGLHTIVLRNNTERQEGVAAGVATIVGTDKDLISSTAMEKLKAYQPPREMFDVSVNPYGDGKASRRIADIVASKLTGSPRITKDWCGP